MINPRVVVQLHDAILEMEPGLAGMHDIGPLEGALARVDNKIRYEGMEDIFDIAAMYAVAIASMTPINGPRW
ncbi:hypothetical protein [Chromobacterium haemolyticum]|uniref:hypothetical protein n=1 Tax=Chromobacterium haemolyticum TaxID=394935 RepID=UPI001C62E0A2|nr:hypothetical protein [Chromobacterium haemolyticum]